MKFIFKLLSKTSSFNCFTLLLITNDKIISCSPILKEYYSIFLDDSTDVYRECIDDIAAVFGHFLGAKMQNDKNQNDSK